MQVETAAEIAPLNLPELDSLVQNFSGVMGYGPQRGDENVSAVFLDGAELSLFRSNQLKRPVVRSLTECLISWLDNDGRHTCVVHEVVDNNVHYLSGRFPESYTKFLAKKQAKDSGDIEALEIPLTTLSLTAVEETSLRYYGISNVQELAEVDLSQRNIELPGSDVSELIERAKRVLAAVVGNEKKKVGK